MLLPRIIQTQYTLLKRRKKIKEQLEIGKIKFEITPIYANNKCIASIPNIKYNSLSYNKSLTARKCSPPKYTSIIWYEPNPCHCCCSKYIQSTGKYREEGQSYWKCSQTVCMQFCIGPGWTQLDLVRPEPAFWLVGMEFLFGK